MLLVVYKYQERGAVAGPRGNGGTHAGKAQPGAGSPSMLGYTGTLHTIMSDAAVPDAPPYHQLYTLNTLNIYTYTSTKNSIYINRFIQNTLKINPQLHMVTQAILPQRSAQPTLYPHY